MTVDATGFRWFPRRGDAVIATIETEEGTTKVSGLVVEVKQTGNAPARAMVFAEVPAYSTSMWDVLDVPVSALELDTSDNVSLPSVEERRASMTPDEAASTIFAELVMLGDYRSRVQYDDELVAVLEAETHRALLLARAHTQTGRHDAAQRELSVAAKHRELAAAVAVQLAQRPVTD